MSSTLRSIVSPAAGGLPTPADLIVSRAWAACLALGTLSALAAGGCASEAPPEVAKVLPTPVEILPAVRRNVVDRLNLTGEIRADEHSRLASGVGGKVDAVLIQQGDTVKRGQLLLKVAGNLAAAQLHQAEAQLSSAKTQYERTKKLVERNMASSATLEQVETALAQAEAGAEMARARYDDAMVRAPHSGVVATLNVSKGEQAMPGVTLLELVDMNTVEVIAQIPERDIAFFSTGRSATLTTDAFPGEIFEGTVSRVGAVANKYSRTFELEVRVKNTDHRLRPGMLARLSLARRSIDDAIVVRRDAVVEDLDRRIVYVVDDAQGGGEDGPKVRAVPVVLGPVEGDDVVITSGLSEGDRVVVVGQRALVDGQPIRIMPTTTMAARTTLSPAEIAPKPAADAPGSVPAEPAGDEQPAGIEDVP